MAGRRRPSARTKLLEEPASKVSKRSPSEEPPTAPPAQERLPARIEDGQPLPVVNAPQPSTLSSTEYQSIAESGVLAAALRGSRDVWLAEGIFERYWMKPSRKKNAADSQNPPKESMARLGPCTMSVGPHLFDVVLFGVRAQQAQPTPPPAPAPPRQPAPRAAIQRRQSNEAPSPYGDRAYQQRPPSTFRTPSTAGTQPAPRPSPGVRPPQAYPVAQPSPATPDQPSHAPSVPYNDETSHVTTPSTQPNAQPSPDPVIQMLAARAATSHDLKELMRVVASGRASSEQLKVFQAHINDLTAEYQASLRPAGAQRDPIPARSEASTGPFHAPASVEPARPSPLPNSAYSPAPGSIRHQTSSPSFGARPPPRPSHMGVRPEQPSPHPGHRPSLGPGARTERRPGPVPSEYKAVVLEFGAGSGDRFLFPKHSILDFSPDGTHVIASFVVVRQGREAKSPAFDPDRDYHQPVTVYFSAATARVLDPLARVVASAADAARCMEEVMDRTTRAPTTYLALRLPRDGAGAGAGAMEVTDEAAEERRDLEAFREALYAPPGSLRPLTR